MAIVVDPTRMLKKLAPRAAIKRIVSTGGHRIALKKAALRAVADIGIVSDKDLADTALGVVKQYKEKYADLRDTGAAAAEAMGEAVGDAELLINRVQNLVVFNIQAKVRENYDGEQYEWLPSDADEPRPEHQLYYGAVRTVGVGLMPGEEPGCRCGMRLLVDETTLNLGD